MSTAGFDSVGLGTPAFGGAFGRIDSVGQPTVTVPAAPGSVTAAAGDTTAIISWVAPTDDGGSPLTSYEVDGFSTVSTDSLANPSAPSVQITGVDPGHSSQFVTGLVNGVTYSFTVTAINSIGASVASATVTVTPLASTVAQTDPNGPPVTPPPVDPTLLPPPLVYAPEVDVAPSMPGPQQSAFVSTTAPPVPSRIAGHVQSLYLTDLNTGEILYITPSRGGIYIQDFDLGYPTVREVSADYPDRHGSIDQTRYYGNRALTLSVLCRDGADVNGVTQSAAAWADVVRSWSVLDRTIKLTYQLWGQSPREVFLRTSQLGAPITGSGIGRDTIQVTLGWKSPDGLLYSVPLPGFPTDPARPEWYMVSAAGGQGGAGLSLHGGVSFPVNFGGGAGAYASSVAVPGKTVGSVATSPIITIRGGATQPKISIAGRNGVRAKLEFSVNAGGNLVVAPGDVMVIDVANRTALLNPDGYGNYAANLYKYLTPPAAWPDFLIKPQDTNLVSFYPVASNGGTVAEISYRQASV